MAAPRPNPGLVRPWSLQQMGKRRVVFQVSGRVDVRAWALDPGGNCSGDEEMWWWGALWLLQPCDQKRTGWSQKCCLFYVVSLIQITFIAIRTTCLYFKAQRKDLCLSNRNSMRHGGQTVIWLTSSSCKGKR